MQYAVRIAAPDADHTTLAVPGECLRQIDKEDLVAKMPGMTFAAVPGVGVLVIC